MSTPLPYPIRTEHPTLSPNPNGRSSVAPCIGKLPTNPTVAHIVEYWLSSRQPEIKKNTFKCDQQQARLYVIGPLPIGRKVDRFHFARKSAKANGIGALELLGACPVSELTTAQIRQWHRVLCAHVSPTTARVAKKHLRSALALAAEDFDLRVPMMPTHRGRGVTPSKKTILTPAQVGRLLRAAEDDEPKGIYYAFPFLTGVRPSEQLGLLWDDVKFQDDTIRICRMQETDCTLCELTKTAAGVRDIPISPFLRRMLIKWRSFCPGKEGFPNRVFPALGWVSCSSGGRRGEGLSYNNFLTTYWRRGLARIGLPYVTPHSARHAFISSLQASGIEIGLVAQLAGHADPTITLGHYTQAVRGGRAAVRALEDLYVATPNCSLDANERPAPASATEDQSVPSEAYCDCARQIEL